VAEFFKGKRWQDVTLEGLRNGYEGPPDACLCFMSGDALRYYLPAFMHIAMRDYASNDMVCEAAMSALTPPTAHPELFAAAKREGTPDEHNPYAEANVARQRAWWDARVAGLAPAQREAIVAFLSYMQETHGADFAGSFTGPAPALAYWTMHAH
jgi:hypothetical protein